MSDADVTIDGLPERYATTRPVVEDGPEVAALLAAHQRAAKGSSGVDPEAVLGQLVGTGSWTRRQVLVRDPEGHLLAWLSVHDRAAGRVLVEATVSPEPPEDEADALAGVLFAAGERHARDIGRMRRLRTTLLDSGAYAEDTRQQRWLADAGYPRARTWPQMTRPVLPEESRRCRARARASSSGGSTGTRTGSRSRRTSRPCTACSRVRSPTTSTPTGRASPEFVHAPARGPRSPLGPLVARRPSRATRAHPRAPWWHGAAEDADGPRGQLRRLHRRAPAGPRARRREGAAAHRDRRRGPRGRDRVGLEVDADSPTGADGLYTSMGWVTDYRTQ